MVENALAYVTKKDALPHDDSAADIFEDMKRMVSTNFEICSDCCQGLLILLSFLQCIRLNDILFSQGLYSDGTVVSGQEGHEPCQKNIDLFQREMTKTCEGSVKPIFCLAADAAGIGDLVSNAAAHLLKGEKPQKLNVQLGCYNS